jgi:very-short-patch-repair endonuclease
LETCGFLCGNPADFQGDERDVIFLSLVDSAPNAEEDKMLRLVGEGHAGDTLKRYNVAASRARDQLWVIHSMAAGSWKEGDLRRGLIEYAENPPQDVEETESKQPTSLELTVTRSLQGEGYQILQNMSVGSLRVPVAVTGNGHRVIISCNGEHWMDSIKEAANQRYCQAVLERLGWHFIRVRGSQWYLEPESALQKLKAELAELGITPGDAQDDTANAVRQQQARYVQQRAEQILAGWHKEETAG